MNEPFKEFSPVLSNNTLSAFIDESKTRLKEILKRLDWNSGLNIDTHTALKNEEQNETQLVFDLEPEFPPSFASENFIVTDANELRNILKVSQKDVPKRFSDLQLNFSRTEKLTLYEHVITNTKKCTEPEITVQSQGEGALTFAEIVAQKKRETRKRRRYRRSKPTHIEEIRAVVDLQMQSLQQYLKEKDTEVRKRQPMNEKCISQTYKDDSSLRGSSRTTHTSYFRNKDRSRSRSYERKINKKSRYTSPSASSSHKHRKREKNARDRNTSKNRSCRSRSRSESRRQTHKRRSKSKRRTRGRSSSNNRNKSHHRQKCA